MSTSAKNERTTEEKVALFRSYFSGQTDFYGTYDPATGRSWQEKRPITYDTILAHLQGRQPCGIYLLVGDRTRAIAVDFDDSDNWTPVQFVGVAKHLGLPAYIETSKSKGFHVWIFFSEKGVKASKARIVVKNILHEIERPDTEVFPKQDSLGTQTSFGSFINAPLFGRLVNLGKTVFIDAKTLVPHADQWAFLESIERVGEDVLDGIIDMNDWPAHEAVPQPSTNGPNNGGANRFGLPPCARKMLQDGVEKFQRVSCFRLAVHLKRIGFPYDMALAALTKWARKNRPTDGKGVIRESEILAQTSYAYEHAYTGYGCKSSAIKPFCESSCPVKQWIKDRDSVSPDQTEHRKGVS
ncbi:MAG: hypothetical protein SWH78_12820 [Thermodesulfobacteriota bacterium]|nr:hypothetical protein [Thermodesulfobacteriota bacterium]